MIPKTKDLVKYIYHAYIYPLYHTTTVTNIIILVIRLTNPLGAFGHIHLSNELAINFHAEKQK